MVAAALAAPVLLAEGAQAGWQGPDSQNPLHYLVIVALAHLVLQHVDGDGGVRRGILGMYQLLAERSMVRLGPLEWSFRLPSKIYPPQALPWQLLPGDRSRK